MVQYELAYTIMGPYSNLNSYSYFVLYHYAHRCYVHTRCVHRYFVLDRCAHRYYVLDRCAHRYYVLNRVYNHGLLFIKV